MPEAVIVSAARTAVCRSGKGAFATTRPEDLSAATIRGALDRIPELDSKEIDDLILGCAMPEAEQGWNLARTVILRAGLPIQIGGVTVNRLCASGLEAIAQAAGKIHSRSATAIIAGGAESMSMIPMSGNKPSPSPWLAEHYPAALLTMGLTAERVARHYNVSREDQDVYALSSHQKALAAQAAGKFDSEIIPVLSASKGTEVTADEGPRANTAPAALARIRPAFHAQGSVTAGNSSQTSDGAAALVVMSDARAQELYLKPLARFVAYSTVGCLPEEMGVGPIYAIPKVLKQAGLTLKDMGLIELNEAFASQTLAVIRELNLDPGLVNVNGGAIALGHPLGCTGAKLTTSILAEMQRRQVQYGLVTMCVGGGMGAAAIFELLN